jgi:hypothetical protein
VLAIRPAVLLTPSTQRGLVQLVYCFDGGAVVVEVAGRDGQLARMNIG